MATTPVSLDQPPAPPSDVQAQMGSPDAGKQALMARIAQALQARQAAQGGAPAAGPAQAMAGAQGPPNPASQAPGPNPIIAQSQQIETTLDQMARINQKFAPWAQRITQMLRAGLGDVMNTAPGMAQEPPSSSEAAGSSAQAAGTTKPPEGAANQGFSG